MRTFDNKYVDNINLQCKWQRWKNRAISSEQKINFKLADNLTKICSEEKIKLLEVEDAANLTEAGKRRKRGNEEHGGIQGAGENYTVEIEKRLLFEGEFIAS